MRGHFRRNGRRRHRRVREETHRIAGKIPADESAVLCITGHGLKTAEAVADHCGAPRLIKPSLREFEELISAELAVPADVSVAQ